MICMKSDIDIHNCVININISTIRYIQFEYPNLHHIFIVVYSNLLYSIIFSFLL